MESLEALEEEGYVTAEEALEAEEITYARNPYVENLIRRGKGLLEQTKFLNLQKHLQESKIMIKDAISMLESTLSIDPKNTEALWYLGKANYTYAFLTADQDEANVIFGKAIQYIQQAVDEDPKNELYKEALLVVSRAPKYHLAVRRQIFAQPNMLDQVPSTSSSAKVAPEFHVTVHGLISAQPVMMDPVPLTSSSAEVVSSKPKTEKTFGWFIRGVVIVALAGFAISQFTWPCPMRSEKFRTRGSKLQYSAKFS